MDIEALLQIPGTRYRRIKHERYRQTIFGEGASKRPFLFKQNHADWPMLCRIAKYRRDLTSTCSVASPNSLAFLLTQYQPHHTGPGSCKPQINLFRYRHNARNSHHSDLSIDLRHHRPGTVSSRGQLATDRIGPYYHCLLCIRWRFRSPRHNRWICRHVVHSHPQNDHVRT